MRIKGCYGHSSAIKLGFDVIYTDTDIVWTRNPLRELRRPRRRRRTEGSDWDGGGGGGALRDGDLGAAMSSADVLIQSDYDESNEAPCRAHSECARSTWCDLPSSRCEAEACGGFYLLRSRPESKAAEMLEAMFERMAWQRTHVDARLGEQPALNHALRRVAGLKYLLLDRTSYPNGNAFFLRGVRTRGASPPVLVHNNWIAGYEPKVARFKQHGLWLVAPTSAGADAPQCMQTAIGLPGGTGIA